MEIRPATLNRRAGVVLVAAAAAVAVFASVALAGHQTGNVQSYTGCLATNGGTLSLIKEGDEPLRPCPSGSLKAHFSGGDITKITAGTGLTITNGDGNNGEVALALDANHSLPQGCAAGRVAKWDGSRWACGTDLDTTYSAGTGLELNGNQFSIAPGYRVLNSRSCSSGQFANGINSSGEMTCGTPASTAGSAARITLQSTHTFAGADFERILSTNVPAGVYALTSRIDVKSTCCHDDTYWAVQCELRDGTALLGGAEHNEFLPEASQFIVGGTPARNMIVVGLLNATTGREISRWCKSAGVPQTTLGAYGADLMTVKVGGALTG